MPSTPIPFVAIALLALCAIVATRMQAERGFSFPDSRATDACCAAAPGADGKRRCAVRVDGRRDSRKKPC